MGAKITKAEFQTAKGRRRAWRQLMLDDHGVLRKFYDNTHEIVPGKVWRSYQPSPADLKRWKARGVRSVVNLRGDAPSGQFFLEEDACANLGLALYNFRVFSRDAPSREVLHGARRLFQQIEYPTLLHCKSGADRAGLMATLYMFFEERLPLNKAMEQLSFRYGHVKHAKTGVIDQAFNQYIDYAAKHGKSLASLDDFFEWADTLYDPAAIKAAYSGSLLGNFLTDVVLRRE